MKDSEFFKSYIPALEEALENDTVNHGYCVYGPDWYISDRDLRKKIDVFEEDNYKRFEELFETVALYFDAKSHNFSTIEGVSISTYRHNLLETIEKYKKQYI